MFKKIVSNLPFNPALGSQLGFYIRRLRAEETTRRFGFGLIALAFFAQIFISFSPPETTLATSNNDIINGGGNKSELSQTVRNNRDRLHSDLQAIYGYYGISADDIAAGAQTTISTKGSNNYYSVGRTHRDDHDIQVGILGAQTPIYSRRLDVWARKSWDAVKIPGRNLWVLNDCGNVVSIGNYVPPKEPEPQLSISKQNDPAGNVKPGDLITYKLMYSNAGGQAPLTAVLDNPPAHTSIVSTDTPLWRQMNDYAGLKFVPDNAFAVLLNTHGYSYPLTVTARVDDDTPNGTELCNKSSIVIYSAANTYSTKASSQVCNTVVRVCPNGSAMPPSGNCDTPTLAASCSQLRIIQQLTPTKLRFEADAAVSPGVTVNSYDFEYSDVSGKSTVKSGELKATSEHDFQKPGNYAARVTVNTSLGTSTASTCKIDVVVEKTPEKIPPVLSKTAKNLTQNLSDANGTTAKEGDVIEYTLTIKNASLSTINDAKFRDEELADVSEYATIDKASLQGGIFDDTNKTITFGDVLTLKPGESASKSFRVTVHESQAPASKSDGRSNDLVMYNEYGNSISINLTAMPGKAIEKTVTTTIPQTGPGTGLFASTVAFMLAAYLYARSRTSRRELLIIRSEVVGGEI